METLNQSPQRPSWEARFPTQLCLILAIIQMGLTAIIFILEVASSAILVGSRATGVGIWSAIPFTIASLFNYTVGEFILLG